MYEIKFVLCDLCPRCGPVCLHALRTLWTCCGLVCLHALQTLYTTCLFARDADLFVYDHSRMHSLTHSYIPDDIVGRAL